MPRSRPGFGKWLVLAILTATILALALISFGGLNL
jgi:hypothetical protein